MFSWAIVHVAHAALFGYVVHAAFGSRFKWLMANEFTVAVEL